MTSATTRHDLVQIITNDLVFVYSRVTISVNKNLIHTMCTYVSDGNFTTTNIYLLFRPFSFSLCIVLLHASRSASSSAIDR